MADNQEFQFDEPKERIWCGKSDVLPPGYDKIGDRYRCLRAGVGIGVYVIPEEKRQRMLANRKIPKLRPDEIREIGHRLGINMVNKSDGEILQDIIERLNIIIK